MVYSKCRLHTHLSTFLCMHTHTLHWHIITLKPLQFPCKVLGNKCTHTHKSSNLHLSKSPMQTDGTGICGWAGLPNSAHITRVFLSHVSPAQTHYSYMDQGLCLARSPLSSVTQHCCWSANGKHTCQSSECLPFILCVCLMGCCSICFCFIFDL